MAHINHLFVVFLGLLGICLADLGNSNPARGTCLCVTASRLNIRSGAGTSNGIIATASYGQCYPYTGQKRSASGYIWYNININGQSGWAAGRYLETGSSSRCSSGSGGSGTNGRYNGCTGSGTVDYRGYTISDSRTKNKLQQIANYFCTRLYVTSGDRPRKSGFSWHYEGRAGDFGLARFNIRNSAQAAEQWRALRTSGLFDDEGWEVIWHGTNTCKGPHIHVGRRYSKPSCFKEEGTTSSNRCKYIKVQGC